MKKLLLIPVIVSLSACSSLKYETGLEFKAPEFGGGKQQEEVSYPDWYKETPKKDEQSLYAVATEYSKDFQFAVDKSMLSAKRELASNFSSHIDAMMKDFSSEIGDVDSSVINDINRTTKLVISRVNLVGVQRVNFKVVHEKGGYRSFVKLRYATDDSNRLLLNEIKKNRKLAAKLEASKAFKELEETVNNIDGNTTQ